MIKQRELKNMKKKEKKWSYRVVRIFMENIKLYIDKLEKRKITIDCLITNIEKDLERLKE